LLPVGYRAYEEAKKKKDIFIMISIIVIAVIILLYIMITFLNLVYMQELNALKVEKAQIVGEISSLEKYEAMFSSVKDYEKLVKSVKDIAPEWDIILKDLAGTLPEGIWFDDMSLNHEKALKDSEDIVKCVVKGKATKKDIAAQWIDNIENLKYVKSISCKYIYESRENTAKHCQFEINIDIASSEISTKAVGGTKTGEGVKK